MSRLLQLPYEMQLAIATEVLGDPEMDIDVRLHHHPPTLRHGFPQQLKQLCGLLGASRATQLLALEVIKRSGQFRLNSEVVSLLPRAFGIHNCARISKIKFRLSVRVKRSPEIYWPDILEMFTTHFPNLVEITVWSWYKTVGAGPWEMLCGDSRDDLTREQQEQRAMLQFGCFLALRHKNLNRVFIPANSGRTWEENEADGYHSVVVDKGYNKEPGDQLRKWPTATKWNGETRAERVEVHPRIINATAARELKWTELAVCDLDTLTINPRKGQGYDSIWCSEVQDSDGFFDKVHEHGYRTDEYLESRGLGFQRVDDLITLCREAQARDEPDLEVLDLIDRFEDLR